MIIALVSIKVQNTFCSEATLFFEIPVSSSVCKKNV